ncbi:Acetoin:2,6-dichlorophenolindophenol oxidoreductase subunit alpha [Roseivivax jejudonensis]|uniref:Pyruvate dehydrogenase E1 component subunit alpha n=1 Tax=Roseivivax jejudonensis TaxID=1529041 RepID=A0A1X6ZGL8_9RHOB|nr:pyruvate dehydrogenase (acetyl-transferring) E1 component subunit alpha [Roseivivax jejudonensis]SLN50575.1 Acetoin:2,6-dichlorophenolindophenol oxidoreductase subunit alpha [Roseivivax jejudonensis]
MAARDGTDRAPEAASDDDVALYRDMLLIRRFEEKAGQLYGMGLIAGFCHLYIGQEAVVTGIEAAARPGDQRITSYRGHGHMLAAGMDPAALMAELLGRETGVSRGRGGSMHMFGREAGFWGGHGIVGAQVPIGAGVALAQKQQGRHAVTFVYFGDAAADQGQVAETYRMAEMLRLPVLFVIENNSFAAGVAGAAARSSLLDRARAYGLPVQSVDGMDVRAVREAARDAVLHARAGKGPVALEARTYRYRGHSMADPAKYRTRDEAARVRAARDPIDGLRRVLLEAGLATEDDLRRIDREVKDVVSAAADAARAAPEPAAETLHAHVVAEG